MAMAERTGCEHGNANRTFPQQSSLFPELPISRDRESVSFVTRPGKHARTSGRQYNNGQILE